MGRAPIIIEAAMVSETEFIVNAMDGVRESELCGYPVFEGSIDGYPVIAARNKVGMINAAIITKALVDKYRPLCLISEGTAGGYGDAVHRGDIVLGEKVRCINHAHMRPSDCRKLEIISNNEWLSDDFSASDAALLSLAEGVKYEKGRVLRSAIGSADFWSFNAEDIENIRSRFNTVCEDMESFAVAKTCAQTATPCLCIRVISNNETAGESFDEATAIYGQEYTLDVVRAIIKGNRSMVRKANCENDIIAAAEIYEDIHTEEEAGRMAIGWARGVYPTVNDARASFNKGELFVLERDGRIVASGKINREQVDVYADAKWHFDAPDSEVMVLHTLTVSPKEAGKGIATEFVKFYEDYALENGCPYLRIDTNERNLAARSLYGKLGYEEIDIVPCVFNGISGVNLVCLEKKL